jgi:hypothetical protein
MMIGAAQRVKLNVVELEGREHLISAHRLGVLTGDHRGKPACAVIADNCQERGGELCL